MNRKLILSEIKGQDKWLVSRSLGYLLGLFVHSYKRLLTGRGQIGKAPVLLKCHPIMSNCGLYQALKETPCILWIALMLSGKFLSVLMKGRLLLPPNRNHPFPVGCWRLPSRGLKSWHTSAVIIIIPALVVVNDVGWVWLQKAAMFAYVRCHQAKLSQAFSSDRRQSARFGDLSWPSTKECKILSDS